MSTLSQIFNDNDLLLTDSNIQVNITPEIQKDIQCSQTKSNQSYNFYRYSGKTPSNYYLITSIPTKTIIDNPTITSHKYHQPHSPIYNKLTKKYSTKSIIQLTIYHWNIGPNTTSYKFTFIINDTQYQFDNPNEIENLIIHHYNTKSSLIDHLTKTIPINNENIYNLTIKRKIGYETNTTITPDFLKSQEIKKCHPHTKHQFNDADEILTITDSHNNLILTILDGFIYETPNTYYLTNWEHLKTQYHQNMKPSSCIIS